MLAFSELGDAAVTLPVAVTVLLWTVWKGALRSSGYWLAAVAFGAVLAPLLKTGPFRFGLAGSHAAVSVILYGFLAVLLARSFAARGRRLAFGFAVPLVALIVFSRLYLGAHWLSEVLGGLFFGAAWIALLAVACFRPAARCCLRAVSRRFRCWHWCLPAR